MLDDETINGLATQAGIIYGAPVAFFHARKFAHLVTGFALRKDARHIEAAQKALDAIYAWHLSDKQDDSGLMPAFYELRAVLQPQGEEAGS